MSGRVFRNTAVAIRHPDSAEQGMRQTGVKPQQPCAHRRPVAAATTVHEFQLGDADTFYGLDGRNLISVIVPIKHGTATIGKGTPDVGRGRVAFRIPRRMLIIKKPNP